MALIEVAPADAEAWALLGGGLLALGQAVGAVEAFTHALTHDETPDRQADLAVARWRAGDPEGAERSFARALSADPRHRRARLNRANLRIWRGDDGGGWVDANAALQLAPGDPALLGARAAAALHLGRAGAALADLDQALVGAPADPRLHWNRALALLTIGRLREGLALYGTRRMRAEGTGAALVPGVPLWRGEPLGGRRLLLLAEQGFGDKLQFVRFAEDLAERGAEVIVRCHPRLVALLQRVRGVCSVVTRDDELPDVDRQISMMDVPGVLGVGAAQLHHRRYLSADAARVSAWARRVDAPGLVVGIGWQGNPAYRTDHLRSPPLKALRPVGAVPGVQLVCLQKEHGRDQIPGAAIPMLDLAPELDEGADAFADTAAVLESLALVITSDTALAHLAGGMGRPTWLVLPHAADWRWMLDRRDSPWYPSMRLFRQPAPGAWAPVFAEVARELGRWAAGEEMS